MSRTSVKPVFDFSGQDNVSRMPAWIRQAFGSDDFADTTRTLATHAITTVCEEARCPNLGECWSRGTATFMLLGDTCTRACGFCAVKTGRTVPVDLSEPHRVAQAVKAMNLDYVVLTSVNRDDQEDGGARIFARTISLLRADHAQLGLELLTPDFHGCQPQALKRISDSMQSCAGDNRLVWGHNVETVPRLYKRVRKGSSYARSLALLEAAAKIPDCYSKSAIMLGLGEKTEEVMMVLRDLRTAGVSRVAMGQYLRPTRYHLAVERYITPEQFAEYEACARELGFDWVKAGPLVRSSYHAED